MPRKPLDRDAKDGEGGSLPSNVMKLKAIAKAEGIDCGEAKKAPEYQAAIIAARMAREPCGNPEGKPAVEPEASAEAPPAEDIPAGFEEVENIVPGTRLHLGDGRSIEFKEKALVHADLAVTLRERGQAK